MITVKLTLAQAAVLSDLIAYGDAKDLSGKDRATLRRAQARLEAAINESLCDGGV